MRGAEQSYIARILAKRLLACLGDAQQENQEKRGKRLVEMDEPLINEAILVVAISFLSGNGAAVAHLSLMSPRNALKSSNRVPSPHRPNLQNAGEKTHTHKKWWQVRKIMD